MGRMMPNAVASVVAVMGAVMATIGTPAWADSRKIQDLGEFKLDFVVLYRADDPKLAFRPAGIPGVVYNVATWLAQDPQRADLAATDRDIASQGDGFDERILEGATERRTANWFGGAQAIRLSPQRLVRTPTGWSAEYADDPRFTLTAAVETTGHPYPLVRFALEAKQPGYFSVGYTGALAHPPSQVDEIWQPLIWQEKRMPDRSYLTLAYRTPLPTTMVRKRDRVTAVLAHPDEFPFQPLPLAENSRFGVALRTEDGEASPMLFAPVLGGYKSRLDRGDQSSFRFFTVSETAADLTHAYEKLARGIYGFRDYRSNAITTLNRTFDNIVDYSLSEYARWIGTLKGSSYSTDVPDAVKNVSSLNALTLSLVTDRRALFEERAVPLIEYMLSREKFLFSLDREQKIQHPSRALRGPAAPVSELTALYTIFGKANPVYLDLAEEEYEGARIRNLDVPEPGRSWRNALALYGATGKKSYLDAAIAGADVYIRERVDRMQERFADEAFFFWPSFVPDFVELYRLYEVTRAPRYLAAAQTGARRYAMFIWMSPRIPEGEVTVNPGGKAPMYWYLQSKGHRPMDAAEEQAPAWRLSEIGLTAESSGTSNGHRAIFMANYAPWMLRIGHDAQDEFLKHIAKAAIIGRYRSFPGYHINTARTTIYETADYPLHEHKDLSVNSFHYNHVWPMASMLLDYLVSDAHARSDGAIEFPAEFIEGYAYLQSKFYGHHPGRFYDEEGVQLWMPTGLVNPSSLELNYIAGHRGDALYIGFTNQSAAPVAANFTLASDHVALTGPVSITRLSPDGAAGFDSTTREFSVTVPANGLTALRIDGLKVNVAFQHALLSTAEPLRNDYAEIAFGDARAALLDFGALGRRAFIYLREDDSVFRRIELRYRDRAGKPRRVADDAYPFEFSIPVEPGQPFVFALAGERLDGSSGTSAEVRLGRD